MRKILILAAALTAAAASAQAVEGRFIHPADTSKNDRIEKSEWVAYKLPAADFDKADTNHDGKIDGPEFVAYKTAKSAAGH